ncbi:uncharacterized protein METZ01_LOCUS470941, partial [marine metagenome]
NRLGRSWHETYQSPLPRMLQIAIASGLGVGVLPPSALDVRYTQSVKNLNREFTHSLIPLDRAAGWPNLRSVEIGIYCLAADSHPLSAKLIGGLSRVIDGLEGVQAKKRSDASAIQHPSGSTRKTVDK